MVECPAVVPAEKIGADIPNPNAKTRVKSMKKTKKTVIRDIYRADRMASPEGKGRPPKRLSRTECAGASVVYCNQWECFTRWLCRDEDSESDPSKVPE